MDNRSTAEIMAALDFTYRIGALSRHASEGYCRYSTICLLYCRSVAEYHRHLYVCIIIDNCHC
ncbi:hypothetical protein COCSUDRAFT_34465 [Coccomyxa subellipsoidea C-169]|uniref:Uncharacterized protein n=1 Tax=Coccomyxa subellipsoidea (strain C-169) TaxID=574566 RepID=I0YJX7_COCSC|nr:hypothetical protein COCSUDRAFT_34465 [Coccomyxa subellipsoidea C-169]EIE18696.1 hypothetical protein COCSUDRAFT_34465 [Coccomyxa subellipsoidea C-169]|eukprot:XP_005643240.1 hypothetical protein COCSUDRAFT_34465 [Coccomyxa subellipsoidea C-169]